MVLPNRIAFEVQKPKAVESLGAARIRSLVQVLEGKDGVFLRAFSLRRWQQQQSYWEMGKILTSRTWKAPTGCAFARGRLGCTEGIHGKRRRDVREPFGGKTLSSIFATPIVPSIRPAALAASKCWNASLWSCSRPWVPQ